MTGILAIWNDCDPSGHDNYERWYTRQHLIERVTVPGFRFGRRYEAIDADPRFFTYYDVESADVLTSAAYMERHQNPTPWTLETMPSFRRMHRAVCDVVASAGVLAGSHVVTVRLSSPIVAAPDVVQAVHQLADRDGIGRVELWSAAARQTPADTTEMKSRAERDVLVAGAVLVHCVRRRDAERMAAEFRDALPLGLAAAVDAIGIYAFLCDYTRPLP